MANLDKSAVVTARKELDAALKLVSAKTGIDFKIGIIRYDATGMRCKIEGTMRGAAGTSPAVATDPMLVALKAKSYLLGATFDETKSYHSPSLGRVKIVGFKAAAKKYPFIVQTANGKRYKITSISAKTIVAAGAVA